MSNVIDSVVSGADEHATLDVASAPSAEPALLLEVISDAICPWCWIGKHRLDRAIAALTPDIAVHVTWRPFELNPGMPKAGLDRRAYRERKFGSWIARRPLTHRWYRPPIPTDSTFVMT